MAACAAVLSLIHTVKRIQNCTSHRQQYYCWHIDYLGEMSCFLHDFLKSYSHGDIKEGRDLGRQIGNVAQEAEVVIENCVADLIIHGWSYEKLSHIQLLAGVEENMKSILEKVLEIGGSSELLPKLNSVSLANSSGDSAHQKLFRYFRPLARSSGHIAIDQEIQLMERLTNGPPSLQVIQIVGMGGIGKTRLARSVYENPVIVYRFDIRIWIALSQDCTLRDILLQILMFLIEPEYSQGRVVDELVELLYKRLYGHKYLIILDDMWSSELWDGMKHFFPDDGIGNRIIVTTRLANLAIHLSSSILAMNFLETDQSWELLRKTTFGDEVCPPDLENIGKEIAKKCQGLPLSIVAIGGLLKKSGRIEGTWESVAHSINSYLNLEADEQSQNIFALSYDHLPTHLKGCYLYMAIFPQGHDIRVSQLINLWMAEGFIEPSLKETAEHYLHDLIDRNLILVRSWRSNGKIRTCYIHDLLQDMCLRIATKEKFIYISGNSDMLEGFHNEHRIVLHGKHRPQDFHDIQLRCHTLIGGGGDLPQLENTSLRVLDDVDINSFEEIFQHVNLRYIRCRSTSVRSIPSSVSLLLNLHTIICHNTLLVFAPIEIWNMRHLRHIQFSEIWLPNPPPTIALPNDHALGHLHTATKIVNFDCADEVLGRIPNIKKLAIKYDHHNGQSNTAAYYGLENLCHFWFLQSLKISTAHAEPSMRMELLQYLTFPSSITKLSLENIVLFWDDLAKIGYLPNLQHLKLMGSIAGSTWNPIEGQFCSLKSLRILGDNDLIYWNANTDHFPNLKNLDLGGVSRLEEIPSDIGDIITLELIQFHGSRAVTAISAMKLLKEQEDMGNDFLQVRVTFMNRAEEESFWAMAKAQGLGSDKFIVETGK